MTQSDRFLAETIRDDILLNRIDDHFDRIENAQAIVDKSKVRKIIVK